MVGSRRYSKLWIVLAVAAVVVVSSSSGRLGTGDGTTRIVVDAFQQHQPRPRPQQKSRNQQRRQNDGLEKASLSRRSPTSVGSSPPWLQSLTSLSSTNGEEDPSLSSSTTTTTTTTNNANSNDPNPPAFDSVTKESEKALRNEIAARNSIVDNEEQYTIRDGAGVSATAAAAVVEETSSDATAAELSSSSSSSATTGESTSQAEEPKDEFEKSFEKIIRQRPYPLFLLEKGIEIVEDTVEGIGAKFGNTVSADDLSIRGGSDLLESKRERVVVLGTGWGAAAFVKDIDTSRYDVTVISPRNYFLFTPMLAGASVGTVDYRSITQPIREVRITVRISQKGISHRI